MLVIELVLAIIAVFAVVGMIILGMILMLGLANVEGKKVGVPVITSTYDPQDIEDYESNKKELEEQLEYIRTNHGTNVFKKVTVYYAINVLGDTCFMSENIADVEAYINEQWNSEVYSIEEMPLLKAIK